MNVDEGSDKTDLKAHFIGVTAIMKLRTCVMKLEPLKGGHLMW